MTIPAWMLIALIALAIPTLAVLAIAWHSWAGDRGLALVGRTSRFSRDHSYVERWCLLYVPLWTERGHHSTWLDA